MRASIWEDADDSTVGDFNYSDQLLANRGNVFKAANNPKAEPVIICRIGKGSRQKTIVKSSQGAFSAHLRLKRIKALTHRMELSPHVEDSVVSLVSKYLSLQAKSTKKLPALIGAAIYAIKRINNSAVSLKSILDIYGVKQKDVSKFLYQFKQKRLLSETIPEASVIDLYHQLLNQFFPQQVIEPTAEKAKLSTEFEIDPSTALFERPIPFTNKSDRAEFSTREKLARTANALLTVPEMSFFKQGKMPQSVAAGMFAAMADYFGLAIGIREIADKIGLSYPTVLESKKLILEIVCKHYQKTLVGTDMVSMKAQEKSVDDSNTSMEKLAMDWVIKNVLNAEFR